MKLATNRFIRSDVLRPPSVRDEKQSEQPMGILEAQRLQTNLEKSIRKKV